MAVRELKSSPSMATIYPKAVAGVGLSALGRLPGRGGEAGELPDEELVLPDVEIDREHLAAYDRVCTFQIRDELPPTYPHVIAFPLAMKLMTATSFPFPVVGLVHIANRIELVHPILVGERLIVRVRTEGLAPHDKGTQFQVIASADVAGETVWRSNSTYLHREGGGDSSGKREVDRGEKPPEPIAQLSVPDDIGRRYAGVSGDRNPIHLHPLSARLFGMPRPIAHGMWLKARCLAVLESELPDSYAVDVRFKLPVRLPGRVDLASWREGGEHRFAVHDAGSDRPHLTGRIGAD